MLPDKDKCIVYHGTNLFAANLIQYQGIRLEVQRELTDFGKGFYVTSNLAQAKKWARVRASHPQISSQLLNQLGISKAQYFNHPDIRVPACIVYELNLKQLRQLKGKIFPLPHESDWTDYQQSWKKFVQNCRKGKPHHYDYVYGPVGGEHLTKPDEVKASTTKDQLTLTTPKATKCLLKLYVVVLKSEERASKKFMSRDLFHQVRNLKNVRDNGNIFLFEIRKELMKIGNITYHQADKILQSSSVATHFHSTLLHEPPAYWAFSILYGAHELWHQKYEMYMKGKGK